VGRCVLLIFWQLYNAIQSHLATSQPVGLGDVVLWVATRTHPTFKEVQTNLGLSGNGLYHILLQRNIFFHIRRISSRRKNKLRGLQSNTACCFQNSNPQRLYCLTSLVSSESRPATTPLLISSVHLGEKVKFLENFSLSFFINSQDRSLRICSAHHFRRRNVSEILDRELKSTPTFAVRPRASCFGSKTRRARSKGLK
jgi:hypothetical protein